MPLTPNGNNGYSTTQPIKIYTALMTQNTITATSGSLIIGHQYIIDSLQMGDDFANVGYTADFVPFIATGTTPTDWTNGTIVQDNTLSAPTMTELQNTIGQITWTRIAAGRYRATKTNTFKADKTYIINTSEDITACMPISYSTVNDCAIIMFREDDDNIQMRILDNTYTTIDWDTIFSSPLAIPEIKIYP